MKKFLLPLLLMNSLCFAFGSMPDGPWREKCSNNDLKKSFSDGVMTAFCGPGYKDFFGGTSVKLNYTEECQPNSQVDYVNGQLICLSPKSNLISNLPGGSWLSSCNSSKATYSNGILKAFCNKQGSIGGVNSTLDYANNCKPNSLVKFSNGELICYTSNNGSQGFNPNSGGFNPAPNNNADNLPIGDWINSCDVRGATMRGTILITDCKNNKGKYSSAALDLRTCENNVSVSNNNGSLICKSSQGFNPNPDNNPKDGLPGGNWRRYCDVSTGKLSDINIFEAECKISLSKNYFKQWFDYGDCAAGSDVNYNNQKEEFYCVEKKKW